MKNSKKTNEQFLNEIGKLNYKIADLEKTITSYKKIEKKLNENDEKSQMLFNQPLMGIIVLQDELFVHVNNRVAEIMEVPAKEIENWAPKDYAKLIHPDDRDFVMEQGRKKQKGDKGAVIQYEWRMVTPNDNLKWIEMWSKTITYKNRNADLVLMIDITTHKQAEEALREKTETINDIVNTSWEWIWAINLQGIHTYSNPAVERILGYSTDKLLGHSNFDLMHEEDRKMVATMLPDKISKKKGWKSLVIRWKHIDGSWRYLESSAVPIIEADGEIVGFRGVDRNITKQKETELELIKHREHLEELIKERTVEIEDKNVNLQRFHDATVNREFRIKELRDEIENLKSQLNR